MLKLGDNFISSLNKVYGLYTLGFLGFVILMELLGQVSVVLLSMQEFAHITVETEMLIV